MSDSWDDYAESWDDNPAVQGYSVKAFGSLTKHIDLDGLRVLDFGCGTGLLTEKIASIAQAVVAIDSSTKMIDVLKQKQLDNVEAQTALLSMQYLEQHPEFIESFDLIVASSVLSFVPDLTETLQLLKRLLKTDGLLIQWDWLQNDLSSDSGFSITFIEAAYQRVGLTPVAIKQSFSILHEQNDMPVLMGIAKKL